MIVRPVVVLLSVGIFLILLQLPRVQGGTPKINGNYLRDRMPYKMKYLNLLQSAKDRELMESLDNVIRYKELSEQSNAEALDGFIEDNANKKDEVLLEKSGEPSTMERRIMQKKNYDQVINDGPCACNSRIETEYIGDNAFPRIVETRVCSETQPINGCKPPYVCRESKYDLKILRWQQTLESGSQEELPNNLGKDWNIEIKPISVGCMCLKDYKTDI